jgi:hypothetical protein
MEQLRNVFIGEMNAAIFMGEIRIYCNEVNNIAYQIEKGIKSGIKIIEFKSI